MRIRRESDQVHRNRMSNPRRGIPPQGVNTERKRAIGLASKPINQSSPKACLMYMCRAVACFTEKENDRTGRKPISI